ncbi:tyrosine-type recombinase/integrase [Mesorhizobium sp. M0859]
MPEVLTGAEIDELLSSFDQAFPSRLRAYAMVRCLIDLGLRSSEVVKLQLDDINSADGTIKLVGTKSRRADALPLPSQTGAAIAAYLHEERPATSNRAIFVRHVAPYTSRSRRRASNAQCWPATDDVDGRGPVSTFSATAWRADFCAPARR